MGGIQYAGWFLCLVATVTTVFTMMFSQWKVSSPMSSENIFEHLESSEGLWKRCVATSPGEVRCDNYDTSVIGLPAELQVQRALMILSVISMVAASVTAAIALPCSSAVTGTKKKRTMMVGGVLALLGGVMTIIAVSWYAAGVVREFKIDQAYENSFAYEFGPALYVGWIAGGFALISGSLMACCASGYEEEDEYEPRITSNPYKPGKVRSGRAAEYV